MKRLKLFLLCSILFKILISTRSDDIKEKCELYLPIIRTSFRIVIPDFNSKNLEVVFKTGRSLSIPPTNPNLVPFLHHYYVSGTNLIKKSPTDDRTLRRALLLYFNIQYTKFLKRYGIPLSCISFYTGNADERSINQLQQLYSKLNLRFGNSLNSDGVRVKNYLGSLSGKDISSKLQMTSQPFDETTKEVTQDPKICEQLFIELKDGSMQAKMPVLTSGNEKIGIPGTTGFMSSNQVNITHQLSRYYSSGIKCLQSEEEKTSFTSVVHNWLSQQVIPGLVQKSTCVRGFPRIIQLMNSLDSELSNVHSQNEVQQYNNKIRFNPQDSNRRKVSKENAIEDSYYDDYPQENKPRRGKNVGLHPPNEYNEISKPRRFKTRNKPPPQDNYDYNDETETSAAEGAGVAIFIILILVFLLLFLLYYFKKNSKNISGLVKKVKDNVKNNLHKFAAKQDQKKGNRQKQSQDDGSDEESESVSERESSDGEESPLIQDDNDDKKKRKLIAQDSSKAQNEKPENKRKRRTSKITKTRLEIPVTSVPYEISIDETDFSSEEDDIYNDELQMVSSRNSINDPDKNGYLAKKREQAKSDKNSAKRKRDLLPLEFGDDQDDTRDYTSRYDDGPGPPWGTDSPNQTTTQGRSNKGNRRTQDHASSDIPPLTRDHTQLWSAAVNTVKVGNKVKQQSSKGKP